MAMEEKRDSAVVSSANARRANDIFQVVQEKGRDSHFLCPDSIDLYEKQIRRPTFSGKLDISWVKANS